MFLKTLVRPRPPREPFVLGRRDRVAAVAIGLFGGFVVGLTSVGSGHILRRWLLLGSIPGILIGSQFTAQVPDRVLRLGLATILAVSGAEIADLPGTAAVALIVFAAAAGVSLVMLRLVRRVPLPEPSTPGQFVGERNSVGQR